MKRLILLLTFSTSLINASIERLLTNPEHMEYLEEIIDGTTHTVQYKVCKDEYICYLKHNYRCRESKYTKNAIKINVKPDICEVSLEQYQQTSRIPYAETYKSSRTSVYKKPALLTLARIKEIFSYKEICQIEKCLRDEVILANTEY